MKDKQQWLSIAAVVILVGALGYFLFRKNRQVEAPVVENADKTASDSAALLDRMKITLPDNANKANLKDVAGGAGVGLASKQDTGSNTKVSVIAGLPAPQKGKSYQAYIGDENGKKILIGQLTEAKGGWLLEKQMKKADVENLKQVTVVEKSSDPKSQDKVILQGDF
jgi:hypothetical protein